MDSNDHMMHMELLGLTTAIVVAQIPIDRPDDNRLQGLIRTVYQTLDSLQRPVIAPPAEPQFVPATTVKKSVASPEHIISMIDGKPYKTLRGHLSRHGLTPSEYIERYDLPSDYPMVAKAYSAKRSAMAKQNGLGRKPAAIREIGHG